MYGGGDVRRPYFIPTLLSMWSSNWMKGFGNILVIAFVLISVGAHQRPFRIDRKNDTDMEDGFNSNVVESILQSFQVSPRLTCPACHAVGTALKAITHKPRSFNMFVNALIRFCVQFRVQTPDVCRSTVPLFSPWIFDVVKNENFSVPETCTMVGLCHSRLKPWPLKFPRSSPKFPRKRDEIKPRTRVRRIVHLSDWHFDPHYQVGAESNCKEPICCRASVTNQVDIKKPAGLFGDYNCDSSRLLIDSILTKVREEVPDIDFIVMTGDMPPHDIWNETESSVMQVEGQVAIDLTRFFGKRVPVFMSIGNHENSYPNSFPSRNIPGANVSWLYESLASQWSPWLSAEAQKKTREYAYYSQKVRYSKLRVISLNTNHGYLFNWWIFVAGPDPDGMLSWLIGELQAAEDAREDVVIIGHIPPGNIDVSKLWSDAFYRIIQRYHGIVVAQFYGHTHKDQFELFYNDNHRSKPISVAYMAPSITPFKNVNPGFRIYEMDKKTNRLLNHYTWVFDLPKSNRLLKPHWYLEYDAKSAYNLKGLSPYDWHNLTVRMENDPSLIEKYNFFKHQSANFTRPCDRTCQKRVICRLRSAKTGFPCLARSGEDEKDKVYEYVEPLSDESICN